MLHCCGHAGKKAGPQELSLSLEHVDMYHFAIERVVTKTTIMHIHICPQTHIIQHLRYIHGMHFVATHLIIVIGQQGQGRRSYRVWHLIDDLNAAPPS